MEDIKYKKTHSRSVPNENLHLVWHGCTGEISKGVTFQKYISDSRKGKTLLETVTENYKRLERALDQAQSKVENNKNLANSIEMHKKEIVFYILEIERVKNLHALMEKCALKIQKVARGFLSRRLLEKVKFIQEIMSIRRKSLISSTVSEP